MDVKKALVEACRSLVEEKLSLLEKEMDLLQQASNEETKSSAGDKYETARAMLIIEKEKIAAQREQSIQQLKALANLDLETKFRTVEAGALVSTKAAHYFVCSSIGKVKLEDADYYVVSPMAPIAQSMLGKKVGDHFNFQGQSHEIVSVL